ncbi:MAG TPA: VOC family protein [Vicinamibacterales bacterium]
MITAIKFVSVPVHDQDRALAFYTEKLGFTVATDQPFGQQQRWIELKVGRADTHLVLFTPDGHEDRIGTSQPVTFQTSDLQKTYETLSARGVEFTAPPTSQHWGSYATFKDSEGNQFVLSTK